MLPCLTALLLLQAPAPKAKALPPKAAVEGLVSAERSFAALAQDRGVREAFLSVLAEDGLLFRPRPENGRAHHRATPDDGGRLIWEPVYADLSAAQDLGFTTGPFSFTEPGDVDPRLHGHYVSVWRRTVGGWRLLLDIGIPHPKLPRTPDLAFAAEALAPRALLRRTGRQAAARSLLEAEDGFSAICGNRGVQEGYRVWADRQVRAYRSGVAPLRGQPELEAFLAQAPRYALWEVMGHGVAESADLAWTHGLASSRRSPNLDESPQSQVFLRLWRRRPEGWRVVVDVTLPAPDPKQEKGKAP